MHTRIIDIGRLIRRVMDGRGASAAKRRLIAAGAASVDPVLAALTGGHGRHHPDNAARATRDFMGILSAIAQRKVDPLAAALAGGKPAYAAVLWAIGHSRTRHALQIIRDHLDHEDPGVSAVARFHAKRRKRTPPKKRVIPQRTRKKSAKKTARKKVTRKKKARKKSAKKHARS